MQSSTNNNTIKIKTWTAEISKQILQIIYETVPYIQLIDIHRKKWLISWTPIPRWSLWYQWRILLTIPQSILTVFSLIKGKETVIKVQTNIYNLFQWQNITEDIHTEIMTIVWCIILWKIIYLGMIKAGDGIQVYKKYNNTKKEETQKTK